MSLMRNSMIQIDGGGSMVVPVSILEVRNLNVLRVYGALRVSVKMLLIWNSMIQIDDGGSTVVPVSILEISNLIILRENLIITSNSNLAVYGQGHLTLTVRGMQ